MSINNVLQFAGFILSSIGVVGILVTTFVPEWQRNYPSEEILERVIRHNGIWIRCVIDPTGLQICDNFNNFFLGQPPHIQVVRRLCCVAIGFAVIGFVISLISLNCWLCMKNFSLARKIIGVIGAVFWLPAGFAIGAAVSFYAYKEFKNDQSNSILFDSISDKSVYGACLYIGWATLVICIISSILLMFGSLLNGGEEEGGRAFKVVYMAPEESLNPQNSTAPVNVLDS